MWNKSINDYNAIAKYYDRLAKVASLNQISKSQFYFIHQLNQSNNCLVIGGGTGLFLNDLLDLNPNLSIDFLDSSVNMINIAQSKLKNRYLNRVNFYCHENNLKNEYDAIICFYYLDLYSGDKLLNEIEKIISYASNEGILLVADFRRPSNFIERIYQSITLSFINYFTKGNTRQFEDYHKLLMKNDNVSLIGKHNFKLSFFSAVYQVKMA